MRRVVGTENPNNEMYGHAQIFREFCSRRFATPVPGLIQHGWSHGPGVDPGDLEHVNNRRIGFFFGTGATRRRVRTSGRTRSS